MREAVICYVQGGMLSGAGSYTWVMTEITKLWGMIRCMLEGKALDKEKHTAWSSGAVYKYWKLLPVKFEQAIHDKNLLKEWC